MKELIRIDCNGILERDIILSALQEYRTQCILDGNYARANSANSILLRIKFKWFRQ